MVVGTGFTQTSGNANFDSGVLFVDGTNNRVGVGTTSPGQTFTVNGPVWLNQNADFGGASSKIQMSAGSNTDNIMIRTNSLYLYNYGNTGETLLRFGNGVETWQMGTSTGATPDFRIYELNGTSTRIMVKAGGNVGIGTTSPDAKLDVVSTGLVGLFGSESALNAYVGFKYNSTILGYIGNGAGVSAGSGATDFGIGSTGARALTFGTNDTERMRIDSAGNLGLGVTPSAWGASSAVEMGNRHAYSKYGYALNSYYDGSSWRYRDSATAGLYQISGNIHLWYNAPSGTAGDPISFTQAMTLDASGRLGIGNTTPSHTLSVTGTTNLGGVVTATANVILGTTTISANGSVGTAGQILTSGGSGNVYWSTKRV